MKRNMNSKQFMDIDEAKKTKEVLASQMMNLKCFENWNEILDNGEYFEGDKMIFIKKLNKQLCTIIVRFSSLIDFG